MKPIVASLLAALMTLAVFGPVWAQGDPADDVFSMVDRAQVQVEQLLQDLGKGANGAQLYSEASTALVYLLTVEEQLKALDPAQWGKVREHAVLLEAQAEADDTEAMKSTVPVLLQELDVLKEAVSSWQEEGVAMFVQDYGAYTGKEIAIPIQVEKVPSSGISAFELALRFTSETVEVTAVKFPRGDGEKDIDNETGRVMLRASNVDLKGDGPSEQTLAEVVFRVIGKERDVCLISFERGDVFDLEGNGIPSTSANGSLRVLAGTDSGGGGAVAEQSGLHWSLIVVFSVIGAAVAGGLIVIGSRLVFAKR